MARIIFMTDFSEAYARGMLLGIAKYSQSVGRAWNICRLSRSVRDKYGIMAVVDYAKRMKMDAVIGQFKPEDDVDAFAREGIIAIAQESNVRFPSITNINGDNYREGQMAADYLMNRGFEHFAFYGVQNVVWSDERYAGFRDAVRASGRNLTLSELRIPNTDVWDYDYETVSHWIESLPKPVAVFACDDNRANNISEVCRYIRINSEDGHLLRIPEDITLLGVDNDETICQLSIPNISSIATDVIDGGFRTAHYIDTQLDLPPERRSISEIVVHPIGIVTRRSSDICVNSDPYVAKALRYISKNLANRICVSDIVAEIPASRRIIEERFRREMGTSIYDYVIRMRIDRVAQLLREGRSVSDAAYEMGFSDIKNLARTFRKIKGLSPQEYRSSQ